MLKVRKLTQSDFATLVTKPGDTGYDLFVTEETLLLPGQPAFINHGVAIELPEGYAATIRPRSSSLLRTRTLVDIAKAVAHTINEDGTVSIQHPTFEQACPLHVSYGTIDNGYRGELKTVVINLGPEPITLQAGDRVSQLTIEAVTKFDVVVTDELSETERGAGGFGSTGTVLTAAGIA